MDISVIIPTFNRVDTLRKGIETLFNQKNTAGIDWEIIVVDNGSTDGTKQMVESISKKFQKLRYCYVPNEYVPNRSKVR
ncbi:MAG: glycosyltransferase, partial [Streptococcaceae bacterium]|nr:glycosyltransferase [Streptococcaceae bacterium]